MSKSVEITQDDCRRIITIASGWVRKNTRQGFEANRFIGKEKKLYLNWMARAIRQIDAIYQLYDKGFLSDAQILYRTQVERLLTLLHLIDSKSIEKFDEFTFIENYEVRQRVRTERPDLVKTDPKFWKESREAILKYQKLSKIPKEERWKRPNSEVLREIAKNHGLLDFYHYGYKSASGEVHPTAMDGNEEYLQLFNYHNSTFYNAKERHIAHLINPIIVSLHILITCLDELIDEYKLDFDIRGWPINLLRLLEGRNDSFLETVRSYRMKD